MTSTQPSSFSLFKRTDNLPTFGGRAKFGFEYDGEVLKIISSTGKRYSVSNDVFEKTKDRYFDLASNLRTTTTQFGNAWPNCPNPYLCPWVGRVIHFYETGK